MNANEQEQKKGDTRPDETQKWQQQHSVCV